MKLANLQLSNLSKILECVNLVHVFHAERLRGLEDDVTGFRTKGRVHRDVADLAEHQTRVLEKKKHQMLSSFIKSS